MFVSLKEIKLFFRKNTQNIFYFFLVSTWRHINKLPFACFAVYMDCIQIDAVVGSVVLKLFNQLGLKCDTNYVLRNVKNSNLYI